MHTPLIYVIASLLTGVVATATHADSISIENWRGHNVLRLSGKISDGIADELISKLDKADTWADGTRVLLLDSLGGSVDEALRISKVLSRLSFRTVVPNGAKCASACGSIIFVAGMYRTVEAFGTIGQHSCSHGGVQDQVCNDLIANHAVEHGVSHGAIGGFITLTPPADILWFSRQDVDGWGLSKYPGEMESGFERSEPRILEIITGTTPPAQSAWRLDFNGDGYRAFVRTVSDAERAGQLNLFCNKRFPGRLFLSMEINGDAGKIKDVVTKVTVEIDGTDWATDQPNIVQDDSAVASVVIEIPGNLIKRFLSLSNSLVFHIDLRKPYSPMFVKTFLSESRKNLLFAANHCTQGEYDLYGKNVISK